jgi:type I restriction enzyme R subunit
MSVSASFTRRRLPHWDVPEAAYFLTTCLDASIPAQGLLDVKCYRDQLEKQPRPRDVTVSEWRRTIGKLVFGRVDAWLDHKPAARHLADPRLANEVVNAIYWFAGKRYDLLSFVVMPSHVHWVFQPLPSWVTTLPKDEPGSRKRSPRQRIQHSVNRQSALKCNLARGADGPFWQKESYDHWVRDVAELERIMRYVEENPVKAGLVARPEDWLFSSARDRIRFGREFGEPLIRA